ncbi:MAG: ABC transporter permease [Proteobacteria bacterium]|nr:ABC transporter permease [Pseudomonadota bacterium]MBI3499652.1 ABC transporter permease [Pseudomonadota bacterium]
MGFAGMHATASAEPEGQIAPRRAPRRPVRFRPAGVPYLLSLPAVLLTAMLLLSIWNLVSMSLGTDGPSGSFTLDYYAKAILDPYYRNIFWVSLSLAAWTTVVCALLGYPVAYYMHCASPVVRRLVLIILVVVSFSDYVLRMYGLILVIGRNGLLNQLLVASGLIGAPVKMMYSQLGVVIGMVMGNIVFMILAIGGSLERLDGSLSHAAALLGANRVQTFLRITLPLSMPGVLAGAAIVFLLAMASYMTPAMLGAGFVKMIGNLIYEQGVAMFDMPFASAIAMIVLAFSILLIALLNLVLDRYGRRFGTR